MKRKLYISKSLELDPKKIELASRFCIFCAKELGIQGPLEVHIVGNRDQYGIKTTAAYEVGKGKLYVYGKNRALVDILRSIAHEMTHMMQDEQGLIDGPVQDIGGFHEDQANSKAGEIIKLYRKNKKNGDEIYENRRL